MSILLGRLNQSVMSPPCAGCEKATAWPCWGALRDVVKKNRHGKALYTQDSVRELLTPARWHISAFAQGLSQKADAGRNLADVPEGVRARGNHLYGVTLFSEVEPNTRVILWLPSN